MDRAANEDIVLEVRDAGKVFPGQIVALEKASLAVRRGEVHCLLGANGAGKSTLLKIIAGAHQPSYGALLLEGQERHFRSPHEAALAGISMIYQELDLVPQMTVAENMLLGRTPRHWGVIDHRRRVEQATVALARVGARFSPHDRVDQLSIANRQLTAIARALTLDARVVIMDEPSASLTEAELARVFEVIRGLTADGVAVLYVSHRMPEIRAIGDRVTVLRGGKSIHTFDVAGTDEGDLVEAVLGRSRSLLDRVPRAVPIGEEIVLDVRSIDGPQGLAVRGITLRRGEIVGLSGLNGSGRTSFLRALFGDLPVRSDVQLNGRSFAPKRPSDAIAKGLALVPEERKTQGLVLGSAIYRNANLAALKGGRMVTHGSLQRRAAPVLADLSTRFAALDQPVRQLSGGNQQKVVFSKWVLAGSAVLLLDEPSRGLDVGAKAELYALVRRLAETGVAVLIASSELDEIYVSCDSIWVFHEGRNIRCFDPSRASRDEILEAGLIGHGDLAPQTVRPIEVMQ